MIHKKIVNYCNKEKYGNAYLNIELTILCIKN